MKNILTIVPFSNFNFSFSQNNKATGETFIKLLLGKKYQVFLL
jgi:hypothetical protein